MGHLLISQKFKLGGEDGLILRWSFLIWMPVGTKHVLFADRLFLYERHSHSSRFHTVSKLTLTFSHVLE
jgi:hypothetical protein